MLTPHFTLISLSGKLFVFYYLPPTVYRTPNSMVQFLVSVVTVCLCTCCLRSVHEPLSNKIGSSLSGSTLTVLGGAYGAVAWHWTPGSNSTVGGDILTVVAMMRSTFWHIISYTVVKVS
jgi:hypothetical protein